MLVAVGGSCAVPVAGWAEPVAGGAAGELRLQGMVASGDGRILVRAARTGDDPEALGHELARYLMEDCGGSSIEGWDAVGPAGVSAEGSGGLSGPAGGGAR